METIPENRGEEDDNNDYRNRTVDTDNKGNSEGNDTNNNTDRTVNTGNDENNPRSTNDEEGDDSKDTNRMMDINNKGNSSRSTVHFRNMRATDFAFNRRVYSSPPVKKRETELQLQLLETNL